jgi:hypothetical protein
MRSNESVLSVACHERTQHHCAHLPNGVFAKPLEAMGTVLACYEEGLRDPEPRTRAIHIDHTNHTISSEKLVPNQIPGESYISRVVGVLKANGKFDGMCDICRHLSLEPESSIDCWSLHTFKSSILYSHIVHHSTPEQCHYLSTTRLRVSNLRCGRALSRNPSVYRLLIIAKYFDWNTIADYTGKSCMSNGGES